MDPSEKEKFSIDAAEFAAENGAQLPEAYGADRLVILPRDPNWFFAYWEITAERADAVRQAHGRGVWDEAALVLRVYDLSESPQKGIDSAPYFDVELDKAARDWYVRVEKSGHSVVVDLGLRLRNGLFISLVRSNRIQLPVGRVSDKTDSQWMALGFVSEEDDWDKFMKISKGVSEIGHGSAEFSKTMALRWEYLRSVYSGSSSTLSSSGAPTAPVGVTVPEDKKS